MFVFIFVLNQSVVPLRSCVVELGRPHLLLEQWHIFCQCFCNFCLTMPCFITTCLLEIFIQFTNTADILSRPTLYKKARPIKKKPRSLCKQNFNIQIMFFFYPRPSWFLNPLPQITLLKKEIIKIYLFCFRYRYCKFTRFRRFELVFRIRSTLFSPTFLDLSNGRNSNDAASLLLNAGFLSLNAVMSSG